MSRNPAVPCFRASKALREEKGEEERERKRKQDEKKEEKNSIAVRIRGPDNEEGPNQRDRGVRPRVG